MKTCIASIDPNWPERATSDNLGLTCAVSSLPTLGHFIKMSGIVLAAVAMVGMIDLWLINYM